MFESLFKIDWTLPIAAFARPSWAFRKLALSSSFPPRLLLEMSIFLRLSAEASGSGRVARELDQLLQIRRQGFFYVGGPGRGGETLEPDMLA
jgi:hypothetical protein